MSTHTNIVYIVQVPGSIVPAGLWYYNALNQTLRFLGDNVSENPQQPDSEEERDPRPSYAQRTYEHDQQDPPRHSFRWVPRRAPGMLNRQRGSSQQSFQNFPHNTQMPRNHHRRNRRRVDRYPYTAYHAPSSYASSELYPAESHWDSAPYYEEDDEGFSENSRRAVNRERSRSTHGHGEGYRRESQ
ncbi:hypothetical protein P280DRAFT_527129 [Massarina eburnea CBS 473.64]|uniref:Uncharacterized protein n=1 Tax=Massarina eburnea CBS 473.64 TaxID=1395130 RepID=A0A6A6RXD9_9PLEO|nr:hypothetical protein P280DRAFT_527129 [Massarina eburnea CBS 473.64]